MIFEVLLNPIVILNQMTCTYLAQDQYLEVYGVKLLFQSVSNVWTLFMQIKVNKGKHAIHGFVDKLP